MRAPVPLLLITVLQGVSGGMAVTFAIVLATGGHVGVVGYGTALGLALIGGASSFTHMHQLSAGRYMLRGWRTSWLSREALTTSWFIAALAVQILWLRGTGVSEGVTVWGIVTAGLGLFAMWVTAMVYATIPAMRSWHSPLTVVALMLTGVFGGWVVALVFSPSRPWEIPLAFALALVWAFTRALQDRFFITARRGVMAATGTGLPRPPYRLQDTGTTKPPYRTQTQIAPEISGATRRNALLTILWWMLILPGILTASAHVFSAPITIAAVRAGSVVVGSFMDRWLFFRDATHSSRVWFSDQSFPKRPRVAARS